MNFGLRVNDANGNETFSIADRITRYVGTISTGTADGSFDVPPSSSGNDVWFFSVRDADSYIGGHAEVSISGN
ncbi:hypothetical protein C1141_20095, partial [Vibrio agarivorans]